jgi:hypothetical protein
VKIGVSMKKSANQDKYFSYRKTFNHNSLKLRTKEGGKERRV